MVNQRQCEYIACEKPHKSRGLCNGHLAQRRRGQALRPLESRTSRSIIDTEDFWSNVDRASKGCWVWRGRLGEQGYGYHRHWRAHRVAYELTNGRIDKSMQIDHQCRNRACVNPNHLLQVSNKLNHENLDAYSTSKSGIRGVMWDKRTRNWRVTVTHFGRTHWVGRFASVEDAERAAIMKRNELYLNNVQDWKYADA